jgi:hypothetical protein
MVSSRFIVGPSAFGAGVHQEIVSGLVECPFHPVDERGARRCVGDLADTLS